MNRFTRVMCLLALATARTAATAQSVELGRDLPYHTFALTTGASLIPVSLLNSVLTASGRFAGLSNDGITYGATGYLSIDRWMLGFEAGQTTYGEEGLSSGRTDDLNAFQVMLTGSYALVSTGRAQVFPTIGVGFGKVQISLRDRAGGSGTSSAQPSFSDIVADPGLETQLWGDHPLLSFGGGGDYLVLRNGRDNFGIVFGVRTGYVVAPIHSNWTRGTQTVVAMPAVAATGPFLRVVVGIGGR